MYVKVRIHGQETMPHEEGLEGWWVNERECVCVLCDLPPWFLAMQKYMCCVFL